MNPKADLNPAVYVRELVDRAEAIGSDLLIYFADEGGYPVYPSKLAPMSERLHGADLFGMLETETHRRGLKFGAGFLGMHVNHYISVEHPEWLQRTRDGETAPMYVAPTCLICPNSPYGAYYAEYVREVLTLYDVDYIYVEGVYFRRGFCFCPNCREQFRASYGRDILESSGTEVFYKFRQDSATRFHQRLWKAAKEVSPETVVAGASYTPTTDNNTFREYADVVSRENQWGYIDYYPRGEGDTSAKEAGLKVALLKAEVRKPVTGTWFAAKQVDLDYVSRAAAHAKVTFIETLAYGATVQAHLQTLLDVDRSLMSVLGELFGCVEKTRPYLLGARLLPYAAILHWAESTNVREYFNDSLRGYHQALTEHHIPFDLLTAKDVAAGRLSDFRTLILPNATRLSADVVETIRSYVLAGGGVVMTHRSGWFDEKGNRSAGMLLQELAGARVLGVGGPVRVGDVGYPVYYRIESEESIWDGLGGRPLSINRGYTVVETTGDSTVVAQIEDLDWSRFHKNQMVEGAYPGQPIAPMILTRHVGKGRIIYITGELDAASFQLGDPDSAEILARAALWAAAAEPPVRTNCPASVEMVTHTKPGSLAIFLINLTANPMSDSRVIRYIVPIKDVEIQVKTDAVVEAVSTVTGQQVQYEQKAGWLEIRLGGLQEYEAILVDLKLA